MIEEVPSYTGKKNSLKRKAPARKSTLKRKVVAKRGKLRTTGQIGANKKVSKRKKLSRKQLWGQYGLEVPKYVRYTGLQGVLWCVMSRYVRKSEWEQFDGFCVDGCGRKIEKWQDADCGHFRSAKSLATRFARENLGLQTKYCNSPRGGNGNQYAFGKVIDQRYGTGTADRLTHEAAQLSKPFKDAWYDKQIRHYLKLLGDNPELPTKEGL